VKILGDLAAGSVRGAFQIANPRPGETAATAADFDTHGCYIAAGEDYSEPAVDDWFSFVRAAVTTQAVVIVYW
jgi:hypothetical protein